MPTVVIGMITPDVVISQLGSVRMDGIKAENVDMFFPSWPMYLVITMVPDGTTNFHRIGVDGLEFLPIFSEEIYAERWRDDNHPSAIIRPLNNAASLFYLARALHQQQVATGFGIDPGFTAKPKGVLFQEIFDRVIGKRED